MHERQLLIAIASIVVLGIGAQWLAWRIRVPAILLLLIFGLLAGPFAPFIGLEHALVAPDALLGDLLLPFVSVSVALILFEGGLSLRVRELRKVGGVVMSLVTLGALVTWVVSAAAAYWILGLDVGLAVLLGAVLVVTGPTVIGPLLRHVRPTGPVGPILKWEGIVIDPIGALLALLVFETLAVWGAEQALTGVIGAILRTALIGGGLGVAGAYLFAWLMSKHWIPDYLQASVALMLVVAAFTASNLFQTESGLLAVTVLGFVLANQRLADVRHIVEFKENLRTLLIATLFILLAARLQLDTLREIDLSSLGFLAVLILVARPLSVLVSTAGSKLAVRERLFLSWMAPRGIVAAAVSSVFALALVEAGDEEARLLVPLTFVVIIGTVAVYGLTAAPLARRLGLAEPNPQGLVIVGAHKWARLIAAVLKEKGVRVLLVDTNRARAMAARMEGFATHYGSALSDAALEDLDLGGIGRLLALTPNDSVNSLAAEHFVHVLGRANVYQLPHAEQEKHAPGYVRGRELFAKKATYQTLDARFASGYVVKATPLTAQFTYKDFQTQYGEDALVLFVLTESGRLQIMTAKQAPNPKAGQTLIALVREPDEEEKAALEQERAEQREQAEEDGQKQEQAQDRDDPRKASSDGNESEVASPKRSAAGDGD